jgi:hypothetical protein
MSEQQPEVVTAPPSSGQQATTTAVPATPSRQPNYRFFLTVVVPSVSVLIAYLTPSQVKEWGIMGLLTSIGGIVLFRTAEEFLDDARARTTLPYSIATFLVVVPFAIWGQGIYQYIGLIVYGVIVGAACFYSLVKVAVDSFKKEFLHR